MRLIAKSVFVAALAFGTISVTAAPSGIVQQAQAPAQSSPASPKTPSPEKRKSPVEPPGAQGGSTNAKQSSGRENCPCPAEKPAAAKGSDVATVSALPPQVQPAPKETEDSGRWYWKDLWLILLGAAVSLYTTVVFERYKRFGELMRSVARTRQNFEGHASSPATAHLTRAHELNKEFFHMLEETEWSLDTDGQHDAAAAVARLKGFIFRATACIENMLAGKTKGSLDQYLSMFTIEYSEIYERDFTAYELHIRPQIAPLLRPYPHPVMRRKATAAFVNYFDKLL